MIRYRFAEFVVSRRRRLLMRGEREVPLIPRYFDLLVLLVERRHEAVHRRDIFERVWTDVIVSDSALSQAIRTIRRALDDDSREPRYIRTVSRHGYRFVYPDVIEEEDDEAWPSGRGATAALEERSGTDAYEPLLARLTRKTNGGDEEERREAAELLHALGTEEALRRLGTRPGYESARAVLRDTRWESPAAGDVPILGAPAPFRVALELVRIRLRRAARASGRRCGGAALGGGIAGLLAGAVGGLILASLPESHAPLALVPVLALIGGACGALGGAGVGAGLALAEPATRSYRFAALVAGAALGGLAVGTVVQWLARWTLAALVGLQLELGGGVEGLVLGAATGCGYAIATRRASDGMAAPRGRRRLAAAALTAALCGLGGLALGIAGRPLVGGTVHAIARSADGSQATLAPLGRLIGEPDFGPITQRIIGFGEAALFGFGAAFGLMRRPGDSDDSPAPNSRTSHETVTGR